MTKPSTPITLAVLGAGPAYTNRPGSSGAAYLLEDGEMLSLARHLEIERYEEGWLIEGRHEARLIARTPAA